MPVLLPVLALAALDSINPSVIGATVYLLLNDPQYRRHVVVYLGAVYLAYFGLGVLLLLALDTAAGSLSGALQTRPALYGQLVVGGVMFAVAVLAPKEPRRRRDSRPRVLRPGPLFLLGLTVSLLESVTALPYLAAIGVMVRAGLSVVPALALLALYTLVMLLPPIAMTALYAVFATRLEHKYEGFSERIRAGSREALLWIVGLVGFFLTADALSRLDFFGLVDVPG
jgi:threonine/homoserine/homoserine lactone efflux protein